MRLSNESLRNKANQIRDDIIRIAVMNKAGHIAPSLSCVDILTVLYYRVMSYRLGDPFWDKRDRLILSKGHGCYALYAILTDIGSIPKNEWENFYTSLSSLSGCVERRIEYGIEASCGSLGHGLPMAAGIAFGAKAQNKKYRIFCIVGDGEMQEGTTWEALQFAVKYKLNNLTVIVDANKLQAMDFIVNILDRSENDKIKRLKGFGLVPAVCNGHNIGGLLECIMTDVILPGNLPKVIIAKTIKGCGLKCMENIPKFHFRVPADKEFSQGKTYEKK